MSLTITSPLLIPKESPLGLFLSPQRPHTNLFTSRADLALRHIIAPKLSPSSQQLYERLRTTFFQLNLTSRVQSDGHDCIPTNKTHQIENHHVSQSVYTDVVNLYKDHQINHKDHFTFFFKDFLYHLFHQYQPTLPQYQQDEIKEEVELIVIEDFSQSTNDQKEPPHIPPPNTSNHNLLTLSYALLETLLEFTPSLKIEDFRTLFEYRSINSDWSLGALNEDSPDLEAIKVKLGNIDYSLLFEMQYWTLHLVHFTPQVLFNFSPSSQIKLEYNRPLIQLVSELTAMSLTTPYLTFYSPYLTLPIINASGENNNQLINRGQIEGSTPELTRHHDDHDIATPLLENDSIRLFFHINLIPEFATKIFSIYAPESYFILPPTISLFPCHHQQEMGEKLSHSRLSTAIDLGTTILPQIFSNTLSSLSSITTSNTTLTKSLLCCKNPIQMMTILFLYYFPPPTLQQHRNNNNHNDNKTHYRMALIRTTSSLWLTSLRHCVHNHFYSQYHNSPLMVTTTTVKTSSHIPIEKNLINDTEHPTTQTITSPLFKSKLIINSTSELIDHYTFTSPIRETNQDPPFTARQDHLFTLLTTTSSPAISLISILISIIPDGGFTMTNSDDQDKDDDITQPLSQGLYKALSTLLDQSSQNSQAALLPSDHQDERILPTDTITSLTQAINLFIQKGFRLFSSPQRAPRASQSSLAILLHIFNPKSHPTLTSETLRSYLLLTRLSNELSPGLLDITHNCSSHNKSNNHHSQETFLWQNDYHFFTKHVPVYCQLSIPTIHLDPALIQLSKALYLLLETVIIPLLDRTPISDYIQFLVEQSGQDNIACDNDENSNVDKANYFFNLFIYFSLTSQRPQHYIETLRSIAHQFLKYEYRVMLSRGQDGIQTPPFISPSFTTPLTLQFNTPPHPDQSRNPTINLNLTEYLILTRQSDLLTTVLRTIREISTTKDQTKSEPFNHYLPSHSQTKSITLVFLLESKLNLARIIKTLLINKVSSVCDINSLTLFDLPERSSSSPQTKTSSSSSSVPQTNLFTYLHLHSLPVSLFSDLYDLLMAQFQSLINTIDNITTKSRLKKECMLTLKEPMALQTTFSQLESIVIFFHQTFTAVDVFNYPFLFHLLYFDRAGTIIDKIQRIHLWYLDNIADSASNTVLFTTLSAFTAESSTLSPTSTQSLFQKIQNGSYLIPTSYSSLMETLNGAKAPLRVLSSMTRPQEAIERFYGPHTVVPQSTPENEINHAIGTTPLHTLLSTLRVDDFISLDGVNQLVTNTIAAIFSQMKDQRGLICYEPMYTPSILQMVHSPHNRTTTDGTPHPTTTYRGYDFRDYLSSLSRATLHQLALFLDPTIQSDLHTIMNLIEGNINTVTKEEFDAQQTIRVKMSQIQDHLSLLLSFNPYNPLHPLSNKSQRNSTTNTIAMGFHDGSIHVDLKNDVILEEDEDGEIDLSQYLFSNNNADDKDNNTNHNQKNDEKEKKPITFSRPKLSALLYHNNTSFLPTLRALLSTPFSRFTLSQHKKLSSPEYSQEVLLTQKQTSNTSETAPMHNDDLVIEQENGTIVNNPIIQSQNLLEYINSFILSTNLRVVNDNGINRRITNTELNDYKSLVAGSTSYGERNILAMAVNFIVLPHRLLPFYHQLLDFNIYNVSVAPVLYHNNTNSAVWLSSEPISVKTMVRNNIHLLDDINNLENTGKNNKNESPVTTTQPSFNAVVIQPQVKENSLSLYTLATFLPHDLIGYAIKRCLCDPNLSLHHKDMVSQQIINGVSDEDITKTNKPVQSHHPIHDWFDSELASLASVASLLDTNLYSILTSNINSLILYPHHLEAIIRGIVGIKCILLLHNPLHNTQLSLTTTPSFMVNRVRIQHSLSRHFELLLQSSLPQHHDINTALYNRQLALLFGSPPL